MSICPNCNSSVAPDKQFCGKCGTKVTFSQPQSGIGGLHCPQCKSSNLTPITESTVNSSMSSSHGNMSSTTYSSIHRNYWMCSNCGNKFRNIQNLQEEIERTYKSSKASVVVTIFCLIFAIMFIVLAVKYPLTLIFTVTLCIGFAIGTIVSFCFIFSYKNKAQKMEQELQYLKTNCFN